MIERSIRYQLKLIIQNPNFNRGTWNSNHSHNSVKTLHSYDMVSYKRVDTRQTEYRGTARVLCLEERFKECVDKIVQYADKCRHRLNIYDK